MEGERLHCGCYSQGSSLTSREETVVFWFGVSASTANVEVKGVSLDEIKSIPCQISGRGQDDARQTRETVHVACVASY